MTISEMHVAFKLGLDKTNSLDYPSFLPEEIDFWLNQAIRRFVKTRYSGLNVKREGFEQSQKRIDDLRTLVRELTIPCTSTGAVKPNAYVLTSGFTNSQFYTAPYWLSLGEEVLIHYVPTTANPTTVISGSLSVGQVYKVIGGSITHNASTITENSFFIAAAATYTGTGHCVSTTSKRVGVLDITSDTYRSKVDDPMCDFILHYDDAKPLRLFYNNTIEFITDSNYLIDNAYIRFIKQPLSVNATAVTGVASGSIEPGKTYVAVGNTITYPVGGTAYPVASTFTGLNNYTTFTAAAGGTVNLQTSNSDLAEVTHEELVSLAIQMALENIEQPRLQSYSQSINTIE
jgi:hypothetical protein